MDSFEFCSIYFASVFDQRRVTRPENRLFNGIFSSWFSYLRAPMPELSSGISPFNFGLQQ